MRRETGELPRVDDPHLVVPGRDGGGVSVVCPQCFVESDGVFRFANGVWL